MTEFRWRLQALWQVLRGRPLIYRVELTRGPGCINLAPGAKAPLILEVVLKYGGLPLVTGQ